MEMCHKTVFLLDHSSLMNESCGITLDIDNFARSSNSGRGQQPNPFYPLPPLGKTLWSSTVENVLEYSRIIWDVFSDKRLIRVLLSNPQSTETLNSWDKSFQNISYIMEGFAKAGPPLKNLGSVQIGIKSAISALGEPTEFQIEQMTNSRFSYKPSNKGRIICFSSHKEDRDLKEYFINTFNAYNSSLVSSQQSIPIHECEFIMVTVAPFGRERTARMLNHGFYDLSLKVNSESWIVAANALYKHVIEQLLKHHDLIITTITGIPMKEEQNSTSSSNYDVNLYHPKMPSSCSETTVLRWSAPNPQRTAGLGTAHPCTSACRITPVDVTSRPSTCLSNFVLSGRSVWLDMPKKGKSISHVLTSHGGEMWMHILETSRNVLEDPPSISEGIGGRVTDYRIPDFVDFMRLTTLVPHHVKKSHDSSSKLSHKIYGFKSPLDIAKDKLIRKTAFWPLTISGSLLFSMSSYLESILLNIPKDYISESEKIECESNIFALITIEARNDPPPVPFHKKGFKKDEQWKIVYNELENFLKSNQHSEAHRQVLECLLRCRNSDGSKDLKSKNDMESKELFSTSESSQYQLPMKKIKFEEVNSQKPKVSLLSLWKSRKEKKGRVCIPNTLKLYPNMQAQIEGRDKLSKDDKAKNAQ